MDTEEFKKLVKRRGGLKSQITFYNNKLLEGSINTVVECKAVLSRIQGIILKFDEVQSEIEDIVDDDDPHFEYRGEFEEIYYRFEVQLRSNIEELEKSQQLKDSKNDRSQIISNKIQLPKISLPKFDGQEINWLNFKAIYFKMIHENNDIDVETKFCYLLSCVRDGRAFRLIQSYPISEDNYPVVWKLLVDFYDDESNIQDMHLRCLYEIKKPQEGSASALQAFLDTFNTNFLALSTLNAANVFTPFLRHHLIERLDNASKVEILKEYAKKKNISYQELVEAIQNRIKILRSLKLSIPLNQGYSSKPSNFPQKQQKIFVSSASDVCKYCQGAHLLNQCANFKKSSITPKERFNFVKKYSLCTNCLIENHKVMDCVAPSCNMCPLRHHSLLHFGNSKSDTGSSRPSNTSINTSSNQVKKDQNTVHNIDSTIVSTAMINHSSSDYSEVLLPTAVVWASIREGFRIPCRILIDSGSQANFVTERICQILRAKKSNTFISITGINSSPCEVKYCTNITIGSQCNDYTTNLRFLIMKKITNDLPSTSVPFDNQSISSHIYLADPAFHKSSPIDMIVGSEIFNEIMLPGRQSISKELPPFFNTKFGYAVAGKVNYSPKVSDIINTKLRHNVSVCQEHQITACQNTCRKMEIDVLNDLDRRVHLFWELENLEPKRNYSIEEKSCEEHFLENFIRDKEGRFIVSLPCKSNIDQLGQSSSSAMKQFLWLEQKLDKQPKIKQQYVEFMREYLSMGHMEEVHSPYENTSSVKYYIPHHCVINDKSTTTKLRVVFNASHKTSSEISLNDCLMVGPNLQQDLFSIIMRFRKYPVVFTGDIAKMYRQVRLKSEFCDLHRIWFRETKSEDIKCYRLCTVTYGTASAAYLAVKCLFQLAIEDGNNLPNAATVLKRDFYVDDVLTGAQTVLEAQNLKRELVELLGKGGFELRKFESNVSELSSNDMINATTMENLVTILGIRWNSQKDTFHIDYDSWKICVTAVTTKRAVLSDIAKCFDPLGMCAPVIFMAKCFMQRVWSIPNLNWDDELNGEFLTDWNNFKRQLINENNVSVPRLILISKATKIELHGFGDASNLGYGCSIYIRSVNEEGTVEVKLQCAKSRVAPLNGQTIPRLELCAALLLAEVMDKVITAMDICFNKIYYWSDSMITLNRIDNVPSKYQTFVANRITRIQELSNPSDWYYVPTDMNPADVISRGALPRDLKNNGSWWNGPTFLYRNTKEWPIRPNIQINQENLELRKSEVAMVIEVEWDIFNRYSSYNKLIRVVAHCQRFIKNCRNPVKLRCYGAIEASELQSANNGLIKYIQTIVYRQEIIEINRTGVVSQKSKLRPLRPFIDTNGFIRVGGRLQNANIPFEAQHQLLLPGFHPFSKLLTTREHIRLLHCGPQSLLYNLRTKYWITNGRNLCRKVIKECITCFRVQPTIQNQLMGNLPEHRVNPGRPFLIVGVDFCGPFNLRHVYNKRVITKAYIAVFICFSTKAAHLELVESLSTSSFIAALRRFVGRRGLASHIYSDNATNFVGAKSELMELKKLAMSDLHRELVNKYCIDQGMQWHNIPPRSPHFGGLWEAAVKTAKYHIKRTIGNTSCTNEQLSTLIVQIEACMNSRPLSPMSSDPADLNCLTPGHFLVGQPLVALPDPSLDHLKFDRLEKYQKIQFMLQQFWRRWSKEYLNELQQRYKWSVNQPNIKIGTLVLLQEDNLPPLCWKMGRIINVFTGNDSIVRVVDVKTATGTFKRAINRVCPLPIDNIDK